MLAGGSNSSPSKAAMIYHLLRGGWDDPNCARPTRAALPMFPPSLLASLFKGWSGRSSNARVERGPSEGARSASRRTTRLPFSSHALREQRDRPSYPALFFSLLTKNGPLLCGIPELPSEPGDVQQSFSRPR